MNKTIGIVGIMIGSTFLISLIIFLAINPQILTIQNEVSITFLNIKEVRGIFWTKYVNYMTVGFLQIVFTSLIVVKNKKSISKLIIKSSFVLPAIMWLSLAFVPMSEESSNFQMMILFGYLIICSIAIILLGSIAKSDYHDTFLKYFSISIGSIVLLILIIDVLFLFSFPFTRFNICLILIYIWFIVFGIRLIAMPSHFKPYN